jgi:hypothetical protein
VGEAVTYKQPRKLNWVVLVIIAALIAGAYLAWVYIPVSLRKSEVMRVLDETSSEFTGQTSRMLAERKLVDKMLRDMTSDIQAVGVSDPQAEYWIEIDSDDQIRFGVLYSDWIHLPWGEPREQVVELQMFCTRPGRGAGWTCEGQDLQSDEFAELGPVDPQSP